MKRIFTFLFACTLMATANSSLFSVPVRAEKSTEAATEAQNSTEVNLIDDMEVEEEDPAEQVKGIAYGLDTLENGPDVVAESAILMDAKSGEVLYARSADETRYPASITKIMTTLLAIENCKMDDIVKFSSQAVNGIEPGSSSAGINVGAELTVEDTLYALMLVSANEAGAAIAEHVSGSDAEFAKLMTARAKEIGCTGTQFRNPHGLPDEEHYTTARDMGLILKECLKHEEFRKISSTIHYTLKGSATLNSDIDLWNHAKILRDSTEYYYEYAVGAKTGFTQAALNTLVTYAEKDGVQLLCVVLKDHGADNSYYDSTRLYKWGFDQVEYVKPLENYDINQGLESIESIKEKDLEAYKSFNPTFNKDYPVLVKKGFDKKNFKTSFRLEEDLNNGQLGYLDVKAGDQVLFTTPVTFDKDSEAASTYLTEKNGDDDLKTAKVKNKDSLLKKVGVFFLRIAIACILIYLIMQFIHRWQLEKNRKRRMEERAKKHRAANRRPSTSSKTKSNEVEIRRNRRHKR